MVNPALFETADGILVRTDGSMQLVTPLDAREFTNQELTDLISSGYPCGMSLDIDEKLAMVRDLVSAWSGNGRINFIATELLGHCSKEREFDVFRWLHAQTSREYATDKIEDGDRTVPYIRGDVLICRPEMLSKVESPTVFQAITLRSGPSKLPTSEEALLATLGKSGPVSDDTKALVRELFREMKGPSVEWTVADNETESVSEARDIRAKVNLLELVGKRVSLKKAGKSWKGFCPFHDDPNPSLSVSPEFGRFRCWSCGEQGDAFSWVMKTEGVEFGEALEILRWAYAENKSPD